MERAKKMVLICNIFFTSINSSL